MWIELGKFLGAFVIGSGLVAWLIRSLTGQFLEKDLERFKNALELETFQHRTRYTYVFDHRGQAIDGVYLRLGKTEAAFRVLANAFDPSKDLEPGSDPQLDAARASALDLTEFYEQHRLYLEEELITAMELLLDVLKRSYVVFMLDRRPDRAPAPPHAAEKLMKNWEEAFKAINEHVPDLRRKIEKIMREQLGIDTQEKP